jgi:hypothetical protein
VRLSRKIPETFPSHKVSAAHPKCPVYLPRNRNCPGPSGVIPFAISALRVPAVRGRELKDSPASPGREQGESCVLRTGTREISPYLCHRRIFPSESTCSSGFSVLASSSPAKPHGIPIVCRVLFKVGEAIPERLHKRQLSNSLSSSPACRSNQSSRAAIMDG